MKNYYEILEVDKKASQEVIDKAYKTLAKKYHPDLNNSVQKEFYEKKMKEINEAYDVLSNDYKRDVYNKQLNEIEEKKVDKLIKENESLKEQLNFQTSSQKSNPIPSQNYSNYEIGNTFENMSTIFRNEMQKAKKQAYQEAYIQDLKNRGYKIKYKHDLKYYLKAVGLIMAIILIATLLYQIPPIKTYFNNLYNSNAIFKAVVNIFVNTLSTKF